jgi:urease accessory protein
MTICDHTYRDADLPQPARSFSRDTITLGWEERVRAHGRKRSDGGTEFGTALARGTILRAGDWFVLDAERQIVQVIERPEPVFVIAPSSPQEWALFAYQIGNRHQPVMITERSIVCPELPGVEQMLEQHEIPYTRAQHPFTPATVAAGHHH